MPVHDGAFSNWCAFAAAWLGHTNAFTGVRFADDPALTPGNYTAIRLGSGRVSRGQIVSFDMVDEGGAVAIFSPIK